MRRRHLPLKPVVTKAWRGAPQGDIWRNEYYIQAQSRGLTSGWLLIVAVLERSRKPQLGRPSTVRVNHKSASSQPPKEETSDRRNEILAVASMLFARNGFDGVSIREIADAAGIMGPSLYHHFTSKNEIYLEVHRAALERTAAIVNAAIEPLTDPWQRLEAACAAQLTTQLDPAFLTLPLMSDLPRMSAELRVELIRQRDDFEMIYRRLIAVLPLRPEIDREIYRLCLVSLINTVPVWYRTGRLTPNAIAAQISEIFRDPSSEYVEKFRLAAGKIGSDYQPKPTKRATRGSRSQ